MRRAARNIATGLGIALVITGAAIVLAVLGLKEAAVNVSATPDGETEAVAAARSLEDPYGFEVVDWDAWEEKCPDMVGWLQVKGTEISFPIMAADKGEPDFYLHHTSDGAWNFAGVPYMDAECEGNFDIGCAPIYGHHMNDDSMFSPLAKMTDAKWARTHREVLIQTRDWKRVYDVMYASVVNASVPSKRCTFNSTDDFVQWYRAERDKAAAVLDAETVPASTVQLVTCSYSTFANERTVVTCAPRVSLPQDWDGYEVDSCE